MRACFKFELLLLLSCVTAACAAPPRRAAPIYTPPQLESASAAAIEKYYPLPSRDLGEEGNCRVAVDIDPTGAVDDARIVSSTGYATLDEACINAMKNARFEPATEDGTAVAGQTDVPISWALPNFVAPTLARGYVLEVGDAAYPAESARLHQEGDCIVGVFVQVDGTPHEPYLFQSSGFDALDRACLAAVSKAHFAPGSKAGVAIAMPVRIPISWRLGKY